MPGSERRPVGPRAYSLEDLHDLDGFFAQVESAAAAQHVPAGAIVSVGPAVAAMLAAIAGLPACQIKSKGA